MLAVQAAEETAYAVGGVFAGTPLKALYRVRFVQSLVWPHYAGPKHDTLDIDIYEHWLEPAVAPAKAEAAGS